MTSLETFVSIINVINANRRVAPRNTIGHIGKYIHTMPLVERNLFEALLVVPQPP